MKKNANSTNNNYSDIYKVVFEASNDIILIIDNKGIITDANNRINNITAYKKEDILGKPFDSLINIIAPHSMSKIKQNFKKRLKGINIPPYEIEIFNKDGETLIFELTASNLVKDNNIISNLVILKDISKNKKNEIILQESEEKYRKIFENFDDVIIRINRQGKISDINNRIEDCFGFTPQNIIGKDINEFGKLISVPEISALWDNLVQGNPVQVMELGGKCKDGSNINIEIRAVLIKGDDEIDSFLIILRDITERKLAQKEIELRSELLNNANDSIYVLDFNSNFVYVNETTLKCYGYTREEFSKIKLEQLVDPVYAEQTKEQRNVAEKGAGESIFETIHIRKDGSTFPCEIHAKAFKLGDENFVFSVSRDLSTRKRHEKDLMLSTEMLNNANDAIYIIDLKSFSHIYVNNTACEMHGYSREEFLKLKHDQLVYPEEDKGEYVAEMTRKKLDVTFETAHFRKDGSILPLEINTRYFEADGRSLLLCVARDITKYRKMIEELKQRELKLQTLMDLSPVGIHCGDPETGTITYVNNKFTELFGYTLSDIPTNREWFKLANPTPLYQEKAVPLQDNFLPKRNVNGSFPLETVIKCKDGSSRYATIAHNYIADQIIAIFNDITDLKKAEEKIKESHEQTLNLVMRLEERDKQHSILSEMRDMLQACTAVSEISPIVNKAATELFPYLDGALFLVSPSRTDLESVAKWGNFPDHIEDNFFEPGACWGLRRGQVHYVDDIKSGLVCSHVAQKSSRSYACLPLMAKGEVLGMLHLRTKTTDSTAEQNKPISTIKEIAITLSEYLSLSIANIKLRESLANQSLKDPLTGLYNRRYISEAIEHEIIRAKRKQHQIGLMMIDVDNFKPFNDYYGAKAGDALLVQLAGVFKSAVRGSDIICRYGGDEYMIILPETNTEYCFKRAEQLKNEVKKLHVTFHDQILPSVTISIGISIFPVHSNTSEELINIAGRALYRAKQEGRDRVVKGP